VGVNNEENVEVIIKKYLEFLIETTLKYKNEIFGGPSLASIPAFSIPIFFFFILY